jgi:hypothetical protein
MIWLRGRQDEEKEDGLDLNAKWNPEVCIHNACYRTCAKHCWTFSHHFQMVLKLHFCYSTWTFHNSLLQLQRQDHHWHAQTSSLFLLPASCCWSQCNNGSLVTCTCLLHGLHFSSNNIFSGNMPIISSWQGVVQISSLGESKKD